MALCVLGRGIGLRDRQWQSGTLGATEASAAWASSELGLLPGREGVLEGSGAELSCKGKTAGYSGGRVFPTKGTV